MMNLSLSFASLLILLGFMGCTPQTPTTGYSGKVISPAGQQALQALNERTFADETGALGVGAWTIGRFAVIPNPQSKGGKGPVLTLSQGEDVCFIPMELDGDVRDLYLRVTGTRLKDLQETRSEAYEAFWKTRR